MSVPEKIGDHVILYVQSGASYIAVGVQEGCDFSKSPQYAEISGKGDWPYSIGELSAVRETISLSGVYFFTDAALNLFDSATEDGTKIVLQENRDGSAERHCTVRVTAFNHSHPHEQKATYSVTLERESVWTAD